MSVRVWRHRKNFNKVAYCYDVPRLLQFVRNELMKRGVRYPGWNRGGVLCRSQVNVCNSDYSAVVFDAVCFGRNLPSFRKELLWK
jgi:hypothetical protein